MPRKFERILDADPKFPIRPWKKELASIEKAIADAEAEEKKKKAAEGETRKKQNAYAQMLDRSYAGFLHDASLGKFDAVGYRRMVSFLGDTDKVGIWSRRLAAKCKNDGWEQLPPTKNQPKAKHPKVACKNARNYEALAVKYIDANVAFDLADIENKNHAAIASMKKDGFITSRDFNRLGSPESTTKSFNRKYSAVYATYAGTLKPSTFGPLRAQSKAFAAALKRTGKTKRLPKSARHNAPQLTAAAKKAYPKQKLHQVKSINSAWQVKKDSLGRPVSREKWGYAVVQVKGDDFCRIVKGEVFSRYKSGRWTKGVWETHLNGFFVGACR